MNKLKTLIAVLAVGSLMFGQCACPYGGDSPNSFSTILYYLINGSYSSNDLTYNFYESGELEITSKDTNEVKKGYWTSEGETITLIFEEEISVYTFEKVSDTVFKFYNDSETIILEKVDSQ